MTDEQTNLEKGTEYEHFVQSVYQSLIAAEGVENIAVEHNKVVKGKSGCEHQLDVYWEFKVAGRFYKTAIECKAFNKTVSIGRVRDFYGVLVDVPGLSGIFATLVGYQSGAKKYGEHYGIDLKELRVPSDEDWKGRVRKIVVDIYVIVPDITEFSPQFTKEFLSTLKPDHQIVINAGISNQDKIVVGAPGQPTFSYEELRQGLPHTNASAKALKHILPLPGYSIALNNEKYPIENICFTYNVDVTVQKVEIDGNALARAIVKDALSGELKFVTEKGDVRSPRDPKGS